MLQTYVGQYQLDLDGAQGYIVWLCVSGLILHGAFQTKFLGILYHKLSTFMLIRRSAGCFKCDFWIIGILGNYFIMVGRHVMVLWWGHSPWFLCYHLDFLLDIFMRDRSYQGLKDATSFGLICDKSTEIWGSEYWKNFQFSILADSAIFAFLLSSCSEWHHAHAQRLCFQKTPCGPGSKISNISSQIT